MVARRRPRLAEWFRGSTPQPLLAWLLGSIAAGTLTGAWRTWGAAWRTWGAHGAGAQATGLADVRLIAAMAALLALAAAVAYLFPVHVRRSHNVDMATVPFYLMAALLPTPLAAVAGGLGCLGGECLVWRRTRNYRSDIATAVARRIVLTALGATLAHAGGLAPLTALGVAALVLWAGDLLTYPLLLGPMCGERPFSLVVPTIAAASMVDGVQYLLGVLGAVAAQVSPATLPLLFGPLALVYTSARRLKHLQDGTQAVLESMADAVDLRDPYTGGHSRRVTEYTRLILAELGLQGEEVTLIVAAARVHDIGKIGIPDHILNKPGPLSDEERAVMQSHPERGVQVLQKYGDFARGLEIVRHHHESWDGTGYPDGLRGTQIPFGARVLAVADSFDAMTSDRPYRRGMPVHKAAAILRGGAAQQWDAAIVDAFLRAIADRLAEPSAPAEGSPSSQRVA